MAGKPVPPKKGFITIAEAAAKWDCSAQQVRRYIERDLVEGVELDKAGIPIWRIPKGAKRPNLPYGRRPGTTVKAAGKQSVKDAKGTAKKPAKAAKKVKAAPAKKAKKVKAKKATPAAEAT